jgi:transcriptional regulator with XRE-family HTH domain
MKKARPRNIMPRSHYKPGPRNRLWIARKRAGYSQKWLRRLLGKKSLSSISEYEHGRKLPPLPVALKLQLIYGSPLAELFPDLQSRLAQEIAVAKQGLPSIPDREPEVGRTKSPASHNQDPGLSN